MHEIVIEFAVTPASLHSGGGHDDEFSLSRQFDPEVTVVAAQQFELLLG